ncbi:reverse transcriptase domain-containing protein [Tanacetum coccineum]
MPRTTPFEREIAQQYPKQVTEKIGDLRTLSERSVIANDVLFNGGKVPVSSQFWVVDLSQDPRVPLILGRSFLKTSRALIDVYEGEITLRVGKEAITFNLDQNFVITRHLRHGLANRIDVVELHVTEFSQEVLEANAFIAVDDEPISWEIDATYYDPEGDILILEALLNSEPLPPLLESSSFYSPGIGKDLKKATTSLPVIMRKILKDEEKAAPSQGLSSLIAKPSLGIFQFQRVFDPEFFMVSPIHCVPRRVAYRIRSRMFDNEFDTDSDWVMGG